MISKNNVKLCSARLSVVVVLISSKPWIIIIKQYDKTIIRFSFCYIWNNQNRDKCYQQKLAVSEFPRPLYHNEVKCSTFDMAMIFHSHEKNPFSQERLYTWPHFESEGFWDSQVAYCLQSSNYFKLTPPQDPCLQVVHGRTWHSFRSAGFGVCAQWFSSTTFCCLPLTSTHSTSRYWVPGFSPHDTEH